ncbi:hypothetical protein RJ45_07555 [Photobacterium gaetbulicola]|uniref:Uncharacterized protein n=1 Tax=Photobacterium gaetbulicola TaxID=1295392 RepID=A0A0B9H5S9_9GAMM|nr:hypothetical protein [Photobacterium gaetbulicola]KHT64227.1 hypothetical protein RJ45_07555 [Photobacterium gaetbulicola]
MKKGRINFKEGAIEQQSASNDLQATTIGFLLLAGSFTICKSVLANSKALGATQGFTISHHFAVGL